MFKKKEKELEELAEPKAKPAAAAADRAWAELTKQLEEKVKRE